MELLKFGLALEDAEQLVRGIFDGHYGLLLGAGFSMSATDRLGRHLPSGPGLGKELNDLLHLGFAKEDARNLSVVYEEAVSEQETEDRTVKYLRERFVGVTPTWHASVLKFPWSRIWTLNIDDIFERTQHELGMFKPIAVTWTDNLAPPLIANQQVQIVHLHGRASTLPASSKSLVFAIRDYAKALRGQGDWHSEFWSKWVQTPFLTIGARLVEEVDLAGAVHTGSKARQATGFPSIAIIKDLSALDKRRLNRGGVVAIDADAEEFFSALIVDVEKYKSSYEEMTRSPMLAGVIARFNQQFELLGDSRSAGRRSHDYYGGDEPLWADITSELDGERSVTLIAERKLKGAGATGGSGAVLFSGMPGAGRSTALLRLGRNFISLGYRVFRFRESERPDVDATVAWLKANPKTLLLFDNAADFSGNIREIMIGCKKSGVQCLLVVAERSRRSAILQVDLSEFLIEEFDMGPVLRTDALAVAQKRRAAARMGDATGWSDQQFWRYIERDCAGDLFMGLSGLEKARGFYGRLDREWSTMARGMKDSHVSAMKAVTTVNRFGYSLPISVVLDIAGVSSVNEICVCDEGDDEVVVLDSRGYRFRHRMFAEHVFRAHLSPSDKYDLSLRVAKSLAPLVSSASMKRRTYPVLILRQLMDKDGVMAVSSTVDRARKWYAELERHFDWNGRFWDQRALLESDARFHDRAYSYAKKSVLVHRHAFSLNTLGRVRLKASVDDAIQNEAAWEYFLEGEAYLHESVAHAQGFGDLHEHPFMTIFTYLVEFSDRLPFDDPRMLLLDQIRVKWTREVKRLDVRTSGVLDKMSAAQEKMLRSMVRPIAQM
ncbi:hypothetical protein IB227_06995 [Stenotrophomonas sp. STM01]|uniref:P-loop NTPase n=1 Tax=Stenotrophomonas sp. STM01 TaxID=2769278 RepID=UPI00177E353A|nr:hypothetical protein [Stenotrophomonas sp. STM01]MBD9535585.1 hypothetical protein [Stenotrophomonas sp. STM01]